jgi:hypothetical protein
MEGATTQICEENLRHCPLMRIHFMTYKMRTHFISHLDSCSSYTMPSSQNDTCFVITVSERNISHQCGGLRREERTIYTGSLGSISLASGIRCSVGPHLDTHVFIPLFFCIILLFFYFILFFQTNL